MPAAALSGGNQQKLVVGRELSGDPVLLIAAHPTRGVDVGAQAGIWEELRRARARGLAVLLISADLDELIGLSDSIKVMLRGQLVADADPATVTPEELGAAMTGADGAAAGAGTADSARPVSRARMRRPVADDGHGVDGGPRREPGPDRPAAAGAGDRVRRAAVRGRPADQRRLAAHRAAG